MVRSYTLQERELPTPRPLPVSGRRRACAVVTGPPIRGKPQAGSASERRGPHLGTFQVPSEGGAACCRGHRARAVQRRSLGSTRSAPDGRSPCRPAQPATGAPTASDVISVLARTVREVEAAVQRGRVTPRCARSSRPSPCCCARSAPASGRTRPAARATGPSSSSGWTASRPSSRRPPCGTPGCWRCSPRTPSSPTRPGR